MNNAPVSLQINNERHYGWKEVRISLSLEQLADRFSLVLTERWSETGPARPVVPGQPCTVSIGDELVVTGYLDEVTPEYDAVSHTIAVNGRSKVADLVDCSQPDQRLDSGVTLAKIAQILAVPYGIDVVDHAQVAKPFRNFTLEDGQPISEALGRAAELRGVRLVCDAEGRLVITHAVQREVSTPLVLGSNIRKGSGYFSDRDRFHTYIVEGQIPGDDFTSGEAASGPKGTATDPRIRSVRQTLIVSDTPSDGVECKARAELEARMRWAKGRGVTYTVGSWGHEQGIWRPGDLVTVVDAYLGLNEQLLVSEVQLIESNQGRSAELRVTPPSAYEPVPIKEPETDGLPEGFGYWMKGGGMGSE